MSDEEPVGIEVGEKFFGLLIILVGFILFYFALTSISDLSRVATFLPAIAPGLFLAASCFLMFIGVILILARHV